jgi:hypothetical protein
MATRKTITKAQAVRYRNGSRAVKSEILDVVCAVTGYHRDYARRALRLATSLPSPCKPAQSSLFPLAHLPKVGTGRTLCVGPPPATDMECVAVSTLIETDARSRAVIPGHMNQRFLLQENEDGSLLLQPASVVTDAQLEYDGDPELRALLARAAQSSTVHRSRQRRQA